MGNKKDPRLVEVTDVPTLLSDLQTRKAIVFFNVDNPIALHRVSDFEFSEGFPLAANASWADDQSADPYWAVSDSGLTPSNVWVWETE